MNKAVKIAVNVFAWIILILAFIPAAILRLIGKPDIAGLAAIIGFVFDMIFLFTRFGDYLSIGGGSSGGGGWSSGGSSGGGFSGGGGSSSGGGASRSF